MRRWHAGPEGTLLALGVLLAGIGRLVSIGKLGPPNPAAVWLGCLVPS